MRISTDANTPIISIRMGSDRMVGSEEDCELKIKFKKNE